MEIDLLGPPRARLGTRVLELTGRQPALLAMLALQAPRPVSHDRLIDAVWGEDLPRDPANALQQRISSLRRSLDPDRAGQVLATLSGGYALHVDAARIDARRFTHLAATGRDQLAHDQHRAARDTLTEALALWRGPALDGVADEPWARAEVARLTELALAARQDRLRAELALGAGPELVAELTDLSAAHPLDESVAALQVVALVRAGRQADALGAYERLRAALAEELGVDPGPALQRLHRRVLQQDPSLLAPESSTSAGPPMAANDGDMSIDRTRPGAETAARENDPAAPAPTPAVGRGHRPRGNVPAAATSVLGRDEAVARLAAQVAGGSRLVTLTGPGGAGKTTLAQTVARALAPPADGIWLVPLAPLPAGAEVADTVARTLGLQPVGLSQPSIDAAALAAALADRHLVLVLDNAEHVIEATALLVAELLARAPDVRLLVTSREILRVPGEQAEPVPPLTQDAALELLTERARARSPSFRLAGEDRALAGHLVRQLDRLPLAIELAASRLAVLSLPELTAQLDRHLAAGTVLSDAPDDTRAGAAGQTRGTAAGALDLLAAGTRGRPTRQRTLRGALDWSYDLLDADLQRAWAALSVPPGGFGLPMAAALLEAAEVPRHHLDVVGELADRSLLHIDTTTTPTRVGMLATIRAYGRDRLVASALTDAVARRHAEMVEVALVAATTDPDPARYPLDLEAMTAWRDDARAAMAWADADGDQARVQRIAGLLGWSWVLHGLAAEGLDWLGRGLPDIEVAEAAGGGLTAGVTRAGGSPGSTGSTGSALSPGSGGLPGPEVVLDPAAVVWASGLRTARPDAEGLRWARLALHLAETPQQRVTAAVFAAAHLLRGGGTAAFTEAWEEATATAEALGGWPLGFVRLMGAQLARMSGAVDRVRGQAEDALALLETTGADWAEAYAIDLVIEGVLEDGDHERARELALRGLQRCRTAGSPELEARMWLQLGVATHHLGDPAQGRVLLERAIGMIRRTTGITGDELGGADPTSLAFAELMAGVLARERARLASDSPHGGDSPHHGGPRDGDDLRGGEVPPDPDELVRAADHLARAAALFAPTGNAYGSAWTAAERALTAVAAGEVATARRFAEDAVALAVEVGQPELLAQARAALTAADG